MRKRNRTQVPLQVLNQILNQKKDQDHWPLTSQTEEVIGLIPKLESRKEKKKPRPKQQKLKSKLQSPRKRFGHGIEFQSHLVKPPSRQKPARVPTKQVNHIKLVTHNIDPDNQNTGPDSQDQINQVLSGNNK